jgi:hypothetical protein
MLLNKEQLTSAELLLGRPLAGKTMGRLLLHALADGGQRVHAD